MNIQRFTAPTSREALAKARMAFGEGTLILFNRPTDQGVEVVATGEETLQALDQGMAQSRPTATTTPARMGQAPSYREVATQVEEDAAQLAMSTLSFQDYVRERMARKRQEQGPQAIAPDPAAKVRPTPRTQIIAADPPPVAEPARPKPAPVRRAMAPVLTAAVLPQGIVTELQAMKDMIEDRFNTLNWLGQARQDPVTSHLMLKLVRAGYSPALARTVLERISEQPDNHQAMQWVMDVLERNLRTDAADPPLQDEGGTFALIGATGVGKTTTAAKLAGICARRHGPGSVGLISLDSYRVGAQEQLRAYGKILGVVAHIAHDRAALQDLLGLLANKKMVLIDTTGLAPRDPRKRDMLETLNLPGVKRLLVLNAGGHGDTLEDAIQAFQTVSGQQVILSKTDEAVKLGPAIDAAIRHQLVLRGVTTGQRVPEDWEAADASKLIRASMRASSSSAYDPKMADLGLLFNQPSPPSKLKGMLDA
jgi:flagellar biosynthesis protein FlhF